MGASISLSSFLFNTLEKLSGNYVRISIDQRILFCSQNTQLRQYLMSWLAVIEQKTKKLKQNILDRAGKATLDL